MFYFFIRYTFSEFKMNKSNRKNGFSQILILIIISFLAIALPITTKLVQKSQENRSSATSVVCSGYGQGQCGSISGCRWDSRNYACVSSANKYTRGTCNQISGLYSCTVSSSGAYSTYEACVGTSIDNTCIKVPPTSTPPKAPTCSSSNCGVCTLATSCSAYGCYWDDTKSPKCSSTLPTKDGKQCMDNYSKYHKSGSMSCGTNSGKKDYSYYCNDGKWSGGTDCGIYGCNSSTGSCNTAVANETYYFGDSCTSGSYSTKTVCESKNGTCYSTSADCRNAHPCTYASTSIPLGSSQCFNALGGLWSDMVRCDQKNGKPKPFIVTSYPRANCAGVPGATYTVSDDVTGCTVGKTTIANGSRVCFNYGENRSKWIRCVNGSPKVESVFARANCSEGGDIAVDPETEIIDNADADDFDETETSTTLYYYGSSCTEGYYTSPSACLKATGKPCYTKKEICLAAQSTATCTGTGQKCSSSRIYACVNNNWFNTGTVCGANGCASDGIHCKVCPDPGKSVQCNGSYIETCDSTGLKWNKADSPCSHGCSAGVCKSDPGDGDQGGALTTICTANTVSTTECYDSTHLKKCDSTGLAWIQGDQCATGQVCNNGVCGVGTTGDSKLSFKIAFDGVASGNLTCLDNFKTVNLIVGVVGTTLTQELSVGVSKTALTTSKSYAIFEANNIALGVGFSGKTNIYARIKGQVHARMYYCVKSQSKKNTSEVCNLSLDGTVNNFYEYPILGGDVNQDGIVNSSDFTVIKTALFTTGCGVKSDLNGDSIVNEFDYKIFKVALEAKYDE